MFRLIQPSSGQFTNHIFHTGYADCLLASSQHNLYDSGDRGGTVVKVLFYKSEGRWFDSRWCHWNSSDCTMTLSSTQALTEMSTGRISSG